MISKKMTDALNVQINKELFSAYIYLSMAAYSEYIGLKGFANWFTVQYQEETEHAMRIYKYLQEQGAQVKLQAIEQPQTDYKSPVDMFEKTLTHEQFVTKSINDLVDLAMKENDHATQIFLQWFVTEQIEEEANDHEILDKLKMIGESGGGLYMLDRELAGRKFHSELNGER
jgi:ferritin